MKGVVARKCCIQRREQDGELVFIEGMLVASLVAIGCAFAACVATRPPAASSLGARQAATAIMRLERK